MKQQLPVIELDKNLANADWIKGEHWDGPEDEEHLEQLLKAGGLTWSDFKRLRSYRAWVKRRDEQQSKRRP